MDRINDPSAPNKTFLDEDLLNGVQGTIMRAPWTNGVQEELVGGLIEFTGLTPNAADNTLVRQAILLLIAGQVATVAPGRLIGVKVFPTAGAYPYAASTGTNLVEVELWAGGGAGGGTVSPASGQVAAGAGGGAGGHARRRITSGFNGATVTVGFGGPGQSGGGGFPGGASSFGGFVTVTGGGGGTVGPSLVPNGVPNGGGIAGQGYGGDVNAAGGCGKYAVYTNPATSGEGGASSLGGGGSFSTGSTTGAAAYSPGAGGGGGVQSVPGGNPASGGAGAAGLVIVREYS